MNKFNAKFHVYPERSLCLCTSCSAQELRNPLRLKSKVYFVVVHCSRENSLKSAKRKVFGYCAAVLSCEKSQWKWFRKHESLIGICSGRDEIFSRNNEKSFSCFSLKTKAITWKRFVTIHNSSSFLVFRMTFIPAANCSLSSSFTSVFTAMRVNGRFVVSQHASAFILFMPKNKFPFESMAEAADCDPLGPRTLNSLA